MLHTQYLVLGAGLSGLSAAYHLQQAGKEVLIADRNSHAGGVIQSVQQDGYRLDFGANTAAMTPALDKLIQELHLQDELMEPTAAAGNRFIARNGELHRVYPSPKFLWNTKLLSRSAKWRLAREPWTRKGGGTDESVADFFTRRLGKEAFEYMVEPVLGGIYAGVASRMHMKAVMPRLVQWEQEHGSLFKGMQAARKESGGGGRRIFSFRHGMQTLPKAMAEVLGKKVFLEQEVLQITQTGEAFEVELSDYTISCQELVWALPSSQYALLQAVSPQAATALSQIPSVSLGMLFLGFDRAQIAHEMNGFGFLVPTKESKTIAGAIWNSAVFPNRAPEGKALFTLFVGGGRQPFASQSEAEQEAQEAQRQFKRLMGVSGDAQFEHLYFWPQAIPQYEMEHLNILAALAKAEEEVPGLHFVGNYRNGVSVGDCVEKSKLTIEAADFVS